MPSYCGRKLTVYIQLSSAAVNKGYGHREVSIYFMQHDINESIDTISADETIIIILISKI